MSLKLKNSGQIGERLERAPRGREERQSERLLKIGKDTASRLKEPFLSADHGDFLYDDKGLPS
jgi:antitoxin VapB